MTDIGLSTLDFIPARYLNILKKQGITTVADLLDEYPSRYENFTPSSIKDARLEENIVLEGNITSKVTLNYLKNRLTTLTFYVEVEQQVIKATLFNRQFLKAKLDYGVLVRMSGKFNQNFHNFTVANIILCDEISREIVPVYRIKDIGESKYLAMIEHVYQLFQNQITDIIPSVLNEKYHFLGAKEAVSTLHFPQSIESINEALRKMKYTEILKQQLSMKFIRHARKAEKNGNSINYDQKLIEDFLAGLKFQLTPDQDLAIKDILADMKEPCPMNRLLQGEVGSGKTIVAATAILGAVSAGFQAVLMCPTEILAHQHHDTLKEAFQKYAFVNVAVLTSGIAPHERKKLLDDLAEGRINVLIGTHAAFQKDVIYHNLGIVIADEEHRFGVRQRVLIRNKGRDVDYLKMSATPIPRSLAISVYGDLDISVIKTMPKERKQVITKFVLEKDKKQVIDHMKAEIKAGHQVYVVTPLINESESIDTANATKIFENMEKYFKGFATVGLLHGKMKTEEREAVMARFLKNEIQILVATSVIEVGVNVVNATTIVVLGAERFGVAQLHQLRGRVMRSDAVPYCFLLSDAANDSALERLKMVEETSDGFVLADYDLRMRGPGEFFGEKQSGSMNFMFADLKNDARMFDDANLDAEAIMIDPKFETDQEYQPLYEYVKLNYQRKKIELD